MSQEQTLKKLQGIYENMYAPKPPITESTKNKNEDVLDEGLMDVIRGRGSQAMGAMKGLGGKAKGLGNKVKGKGQEMAGKGLKRAHGAAAVLAKKGADALGLKGVDSDEQSVKKAYDNSKMGGLGNNLEIKGQQAQAAGQKQQRAGARAGQEGKYRGFINSAANTIANDLKKLNMPLKTDGATFKKEFMRFLSQHMKEMSGNQYRSPKHGLGKRVIKPMD